MLRLSSRYGLLQEGNELETVTQAWPPCQRDVTLEGCCPFDRGLTDICFCFGSCLMALDLSGCGGGPGIDTLTDR